MRADDGRLVTRALRSLLLASLILAGCQAEGAEVSPAAVAERPAPTPRVAVPPTPTPRPTPTVAPTPTLPPRTAFALNLYEDGDFVPQHTFEWCVGASIQMAHNLVHAERRTSYADQEALWNLARSHSSNSFNGANPRGWATALEEIGVGEYELVSVPTLDDALRTAAAAMRDTGLPVGLVMWRGRHAWVMNGFEAVGDPAIHRDFDVTGVRVLDPLYPHGSGAWGPSPAPNSLLTPAQLAEQFVVREPRRWSSELAAGFPLVLPVAASER
jgi:hypothetical protein